MLDISYATRDRRFDEFLTSRERLSFAAPVWQPRLVLAPAWRLDPRSRLFKRLLDVAVASICLVLLAIPALFLMAAIRMESRGPVLFRQQRVGLHGVLFTMYKFRSMRQRDDHPGVLRQRDNRPGVLRQRDDHPGVLRQATRDDPRVTRIGGWMRRHSLDEVPQLLNVLRGDMSAVGPRPHAPGTRAGGRLFEDVTHRYAARHCVKPGMTGLAQVRGWRGETDTEEKLLRRIDCDLEYIATWSARLDLSIIGRTAGTVLRAHNAY